MATRRLSIEVRGVVQGVGYRPFVVGLAEQLGLSGEVANVGGAVRIEAEGSDEALAAFVAALRGDAPSAARVAFLAVRELEPTLPAHAAFVVRPSASSGDGAFVAADRAPCLACEAEHDEPSTRRARYPFASCNACGPRWTVIRAAPYERARTSMASFDLCDLCAAELADPRGRHFLAETVACPACGPRLVFEGAAPDGAPEAALDRAAFAIARGAVVAVKGIGGYHLACDAGDEAAVLRLRRRKLRDAKPFAVLVADLAAAEAIAALDDAERAALASTARPIVLARRRADADVPIADAVAPRSPWLGLLLPPSLLHRALARAVGRPMVLTSGNRGGEPMAVDAAGAREALAGIADAFLHHDRAIVVRVDDSVLRVVRGRPLFVRRARGYAPEPIALDTPLRAPLLAVGGDLKAAFAIGAGAQATVIHHLGDLGDVEATRDFERTLDHAEAIAGVRPSVIVHDLHPEYEATRLAAALAARRAGRAVAVPHHHAHAAACLGEHAFRGEAIVFAFDGLGLGDDGALRGGEILIGRAPRFVRAGQLRFVAMPGGDRAAREPWRMALAHLVDADLPVDRLRPWAPEATRALALRVVRDDAGVPRVSSVGRLFDAVACLAGLAGTTSHEGQAAMELEGLAATHVGDRPHPLDLHDRGSLIELDSRPLVRAVVRDVEAGAGAGVVAARFHRGLAEGVVRTAIALRERGAPFVVALCGGVFVNAILLAACEERLEDAGFVVLRPLRLPPNDGGLSFGQICLASGQATTDDSG